MSSTDAEISEVKIVDTKGIFIGMAIAASITLIVVLVLVLLTTHSFEAISKPYESPDISKSNNSIIIKMPNMDSYVSASKLVTGKPVHFLLDLGEMSSSAAAGTVTITGDKGQSILFFPKSYGQNKIQFQYAFPSPGTFNVDITFGASEGVNVNINVGAGGIL